MASESGIRNHKKSSTEKVAGGVEPSFLVFYDGKQEGPFTRDELEEMHRAGTISALVPCRPRNEKEWRDLGFILKNRGKEFIPARAMDSVSTVPPEGEALPVLVTELIANVQRQNLLLGWIKWSLLLLVLALAGSVTGILYVLLAQ